MPRLAVASFLVALAAITAPAAHAQDLKRVPAAADTTRRTDAASAVPVDSAMRDIERAVAALAASVQDVVTRTANDPKVRLAAVRAAGSAVGLAQQALAQHTSEIERVLAQASRLLAEAEAAQREKAARP